MNYKPSIFLILIVISVTSFAEPITYTSSKEQTLLIELYSSEGCSSCPPADHFVSQFKQTDDLWTKYIPMVFHVDYWDYIGWKDVFASPDFSNRQRNHKQQGNISSVYTPGFIINGTEWTGFFNVLRTLPEAKEKPGMLSAKIDRHQATISFSEPHKDLNYNLVIVGMGLKTKVKSGENAGHELSHDFVVLSHQSQNSNQAVTFTLPLIVKHRPEKFALVAWVSETHSLKPIQAVGGYLPKNMIKVL